MSIPPNQNLQRTNIEVAEAWAKDAKTAFLSVIPDEKIWNRECMFAIQALRRSEMLQKASPISIRTAVANLALTGITLNPALQLAFLIPRDGECCLDFSYRGLIKILTDSGSVKAIDAHVVFNHDEFDYEQGSEPFVHYKMNLTPPDKWEPTALKIWESLKCSFTMAYLQDGTKSICIMPKWKLERTAKSSKAWGNKKMPWETYTDEQIRKVAIKYHYKTLPQTERASEAIRILNEHEGLDLEKDKTGERSKDLDNRVAEMAKEAADRETRTKDPSEAPGTQQGPSSASKAGICTCAEMEREGVNVWDCSKHGRVAAPGR